MATELVTYSTLRNALQKYRKLDDADAIFIGKMLLTAHVELMKSGFNWFGTEEDIEFTDTGLKLSWNNSTHFDDESPFPVILSRLAGKLEITEQKILPFPKNKVL